MSGSLLGRGRGGRLAVYTGGIAVVVLLVFAYRAAVSEMARLRDLHEQCTIHQESLQQRLQVIFDYKVKLEKSLADETSANAAVKQELQQRATREKSRRDKDTVEAIQRYNSLQQAHKTLEIEKQDLKEECDKREQQALADTTRLETTLQGLRAELKQAKDDKLQAIERLKSIQLSIDTEKSKIEEKYNDLVKTNNDVNMQNERLQKTVSQLNREIDNVKRSCNGASLVIPSLSSSPSSILGGLEMRNDHQSDVENVLENQAGQAGGGGAVAGSQNSINLARPPSEQQVSPPSKNENGNEPQPIQAPRDHHAIRASVKNIDDAAPNEVMSDVGFELDGGGLIVPVGPQHPALADDKENESTSTTMQSKINTTRGSEVFIKSSTKSSIQSAERIYAAERMKLKLPIGVLPIPKLFDPEKNPAGNYHDKKNENGGAVDAPEINLEKNKLQFPGGNPNEQNNVADHPRQHQPIGRRSGDQSLGRQENWVWQHKVPPGIQEVGEEPNNLEKIPELEDTGNHPNGDGIEYGQYEGGDYDKEIPKNNDLHIEEGEDEGEDEDDPMEYEGNNLKVDKHPE